MRASGSASMGQRIAAALLAGALVPLAVLGGLVYVEEANHERAEAVETLTALANLQEARVEAFEQANLGLARQIAGRTDVRTELASASDGAGAELGSVLRDLNEARNASPGVLSVTATDRSGTVVASTRPGLAGTVLPGLDELDLGNAEDVVVDVLGPGRAEDGAGPLSSTDARPRLRVAAPVALGGRPVGAVTVEVAITPLVELTTDRTGFGETGETLLAVRTADGDALFVTPLRFDPDAEFSRTVPSDAEQVPVTTALREQERVLHDAVDYREEPVLAATRYLPDSGLGLVVKIDRDEAFAPIHELRQMLVTGAALATLVAVALAWVLGGRLSRPIRELQDVATHIGRGELGVRADTSAPGELGELAGDLNQMADEVAAARAGLESEVAARTADLRTKVRELEHRNEELDAFSSAVAHDLKSPLTVIKGALETVQSGRVDPARAETMLEASASAAEQMRTLIDDLLVLARTGVAEVGRDDVSLDHVVADVVTALDLGDVVEVEPLPMITGDRALLHQALQNLLDNAARYGGADGGTPRVCISAIDLDEESWAVAVDDDGHGIPVDEREVVFRPFTRGSSSSGTSGTGVGLAIVARIAEHHGGQALATDSPLGGARMLLVFPHELVIAPAGHRQNA